MPEGTANLSTLGSSADRALNPVVQVIDVSKRFGAVEALRNVSFDVRPGEILGVIGRSGSGKSTLIRMLNGLERPDSGLIAMDGLVISGLEERALIAVRRRIGMVFQHFNLLSAKTAAENIALPLKIAGVRQFERARRVAELLDLVGLADRAEFYPAQLSGGQKQRVGIARALATNPSLLLCDEATSALDPETTASILALLQRINEALGITIVLITHEMSVIRRIAHRVIVLNAGEMVESGPVWELFATPRTEMTRQLLHSFRPQLPERYRLAMHQDPTPGDSAVLRIDLHGAQADEPLLAELARYTGRATNLLHGGVDDVQGRPVATMFIGLATDNDADVEDAVAFLGPRVTAVEVMGYVAGRH